MVVEENIGFLVIKQFLEVKVKAKEK